MEKFLTTPKVAEMLLSEHIAAGLNGITLDDDWQTGEALNGRR